MHHIICVFLSAISGTNQAPRTGTDVLLDLLSIETPPAQSSLSIPDILSTSQVNKSPVSSLEGLSSPSSLSARATSPVGAAPMMDLLDGFVPNSPIPGKIWSQLEIFFRYGFCQSCDSLLLYEQKIMVQFIHLSSRLRAAL
jgi:hypothetical protein